MATKKEIFNKVLGLYYGLQSSMIYEWSGDLEDESYGYLDEEIEVLEKEWEDAE